MVDISIEMKGYVNRDQRVCWYRPEDMSTGYLNKTVPDKMLPDKTVPIVEMDKMVPVSFNLCH